MAIKTDDIKNPRKEDMRVVKTKRSLLISFFELLSLKTFEEITVNELCNHADVRRATFYKHFSDKYDFLSKVVKMLRDEFDLTVWKKSKPDSTKEYYVEYVKMLVIYIDTHYLAAKNVLESSLKENIVSIIAKQNYDETKERLERSVEMGMVLPASVETTSLMLIGGITQILVSWVASERQSSSAEISHEIEALLSCIIKD